MLIHYTLGFFLLKSTCIKAIAVLLKKSLQRYSDKDIFGYQCQISIVNASLYEDVKRLCFKAYSMHGLFSPERTNLGTIKAVLYVYVSVNLCNQAIRELTENFRQF